MSPSMQQQVEWRRAKVLELISKGETNQSEIARILQVDRSTICRDGHSVTAVGRLYQ
jgi:DNA-directed RNA polymerase specialized sigma subunit